MLRIFGNFALCALIISLPNLARADDKTKKKVKVQKRKAVNAGRKTTPKALRKAAIAKKKADIKARRDLNGDGKVSKKEKKRTQRHASGLRETDGFFKRHDKNRDGRISHLEAPRGKKIAWFRKIDKNNNGSIERSEYFDHIRPEFRKRSITKKRPGAVAKRPSKPKKPSDASKAAKRRVGVDKDKSRKAGAAKRDRKKEAGTGNAP